MSALRLQLTLSTGDTGGSGSRPGLPWTISDFRKTHVDLSAARPVAIHICFRHHPDSRPDPIARRHPSHDLDLAILDRGFTSGYQTSTLNGVDDTASSRIGDCHALGKVCSSASAVGGEVQCVAVGDGVHPNRVGCQGGNDIEGAVFDERVVRVGSRPLELLITAY